MKHTRYNFREESGEVQIYVPFAQLAPEEATILLRTSGDPQALLPLVRQRISEVDRRQPIFYPYTMEEQMSFQSAPWEVVSLMVAGFGGLALLLASVGVYGVVACAVAQRNKEFGIRAALGAARMDLLTLVLRYGVKLGLIGALPGLLAAIAAGRLIRSVIPEVTRMEALIFAGTPLFLVLTVVLAALVPAVRAARVDPLRALRQD